MSHLTVARVGICALTFLAAVVGFVVSEPSSNRVFGEDGVVEWATAGLFLLATALSIATLMSRRVSENALLYGLVTALAGLCFLDEISFGARLFGWQMPKMSGGGEFDGAHDLAILTARAIRALNSTGRTVLAIIIVVPLIAMVVLFKRCRNLPPQTIAWLFEDARRLIVLTAVGMLGLSLLVDVVEPALHKVEELVEFSAGALLALVAVLDPLQLGVPPAGPLARIYVVTGRKSTRGGATGSVDLSN